MRRAALALLALVCATPAQADDAASAAARFYAIYGGFHPSDGVPDAAGRAKYAASLSGRLNALIAAAGRAEDRFRASNKDSPPLLEGDLFTSMFEGATAWKVGPCTGDARAAHCTVDLRHDSAGQKPATWRDTLYLVAEGGGWKVDDIGYGAGFAFGNKGRLSDTLKSAASFGR
jgi:hypothetical protein